MRNEVYITRQNLVEQRSKEKEILKIAKATIWIFRANHLSRPIQHSSPLRTAYGIPKNKPTFTRETSYPSLTFYHEPKLRKDEFSGNWVPQLPMGTVLGKET